MQGEDVKLGVPASLTVTLSEYVEAVSWSSAADEICPPVEEMVKVGAAELESAYVKV